MSGRGARIASLAVLLGAAVGCASSAEDAAPAGESAGRELFMTHGCAACHGPEGRGNGPLAATLDPPPRDFRDRGAYKRGPAREQIERTLSLGLLGESFSAMPSYPHLTPDERRLLAEHVIALQGDASVKPGLLLRGGWIRVAPPTARATAAYFELENPTAETLQVTGVRCDLAETSEIHESVTDGGVMSMRPRPVVAVHAGETVSFTPGGLHVMLIGLKRPAAPGETARLTLLSDGAPPVEAILEVRQGASP